MLIDNFLDNLQIGYGDKVVLRRRIYNLALLELVVEFAHLWTIDEKKIINDFLSDPESINPDDLAQILEKPEYQEKLIIILADIIKDILNNEAIVSKKSRDTIKSNLLASLIAARFGDGV